MPVLPKKAIVICFVLLTALAATLSFYRNYRPNLGLDIRRPSPTVRLLSDDERTHPSDLSPSNITIQREKTKCIPRMHVAFVKVHKCASSTIGSVLIKYGYQRHLLFGLPAKDGGHIGWPFPLLPAHVYRLKQATYLNKKIDMIVHHMVFNYKTLQSIMPKDSVYLSILREPFDQFRSAINFFDGPRKALKLPSGDHVINFLSDPEKYERPCPFWFSNRMAGATSITHNMMATDLGYSSKKFNDPVEIQQFIKSLDEKFNLVMIKERITESLVLMRRRLCWDIRDIFFLKVNIAHTPEKIALSYSEELKAKYYNWSKVDYELYKFFDFKFSILVDNEGADFSEEVKFFTVVNEAINDYCRSRKNTGSHFEWPESRWSDRIIFKRAECDLLSKIPYQMTGYLKKSFDQMVPGFKKR